jgi:hypothetical protein
LREITGGILNDFRLFKGAWRTEEKMWSRHWIIQRGIGRYIGNSYIGDEIERHTKISREHLTPELQLHLLTPDCPLYTARATGLPRHFAEPFWSIYWPGGQALARYLLDEGPRFLRGLSAAKVLDLGAGCGAAAIAAKIIGADDVLVNDIDPGEPRFIRAPTPFPSPSLVVPFSPGSQFFTLPCCSSTSAAFNALYIHFHTFLYTFSFSPFFLTFPRHFLFHSSSILSHEYAQCLDELMSTVQIRIAKLAFYFKLFTHYFFYLLAYSF